MNTPDTGKRILLAAFLSTLAAATIGASIGSAQGAPKANTQAKPTIDGKAKLAEILNAIPNLRFSKGIPANFPVPSYTSNVVKTNFENSITGPPRANASIITKDRPDQVYQWYQDNCKKANWILELPSDKFMQQIGKKGHLYMMTGQRDKEEIRIFCTDNKKPVGTMINILWMKKS